MMADLFFGGLPRRPPIRRMRVIDVGAEQDGQHLVRYECSRCGSKTGWVVARTVSEAKRGIPCVNCEATR